MIAESPQIEPVQTNPDLPAQTTVVVIGGGIVGLSAALTLAERGVPVTVIEKGRVAGEQSSRNLGWIRKTSRAKPDLPLSIETERLWQDMARRTNADVGYRQEGIMFAARDEEELATYADWFNDVAKGTIDSRMIGNDEIDRLVPGSAVKWAGAVYTPSDGRAEPTMASSAIANAAIRKGAEIVENCAVRLLSTSGGKVSGVVTERGEIKCAQAVLAGGMWSRRFLANHGVNYYALPLTISVLRTAPMDGPTEIAVGASNFSFRKDHTGGYTIMNRAGLVAPVTLDSFLLGPKYLGSLKTFWKAMRLELGRDFLNDVTTARSWKADDTTPFEKTRINDPSFHPSINDEAMRNLATAWPVFSKATISRQWAGMIDITPDSLPVISPVAAIPGLTIASGFSGHGFGSGPAAGQLAADIATGNTPLVDPAPYRLERFN